MENKDGGPAFPVVGMDRRGEQQFLGVFNSGMTLRQWYAGKALVGLVSRCSRPEDIAGNEGHIAACAFILADAMLAAREARTGGPQMNISEIRRMASEGHYRLQDMPALLARVEELEDEQRRLVVCTQTFLDHYLRLANCGDCGNWDPETEAEVIAIRAALAAGGGR